MAWIAGDSFDYYGTVADVARSVWDAATITANTFGLTTGRFGTGQAIQGQTTLTASPWLVKNVPTNEATLFVALAYYRPGAQSGTNPEAYLQFRDGATAQCTVVFESSGSIVLKSGIHTGTVLATYTGAFAQDVWTHFQIRIVISGTAGSMTVRKNGQTSDTYASVTTLNTRGGTANSYANVVALGYGTSVSTRVVLDDVVLYSATAPAPNDWIGDVRAVCLMPTADTAQKQFTPLVATITAGMGTSTSPAAFAANTLWINGPVLLGRGGPVVKVTLTFASAMTGNAQVAFYAADGAGNAPGTLLASSAVVTNPATGPVDFTFTGFALVPSRLYHLAYLADASPASGINGATGVTKYSAARTYAAGFPNPAPTGMTTATNPPFANVVVTGNAGLVSELLANGDTDYVFDSVVGDSDLYDLDDLPTTPASVIGVVAKLYVKKSDSGTRQGQVLLASGGTQVAGADTVLGTTYTYLARVDTVDPATGVAWTPAAVNAVKIGQKVTA